MSSGLVERNTVLFSVLQATVGGHQLAQSDRACVCVSIHSVNINILYDELVTALKRCTALNIPQARCV